MQCCTAFVCVLETMACMSPVSMMMVVTFVVGAALHTFAFLCGDIIPKGVCACMCDLCLPFYCNDYYAIKLGKQAATCVVCLCTCLCSPDQEGSGTGSGTGTGGWWRWDLQTCLPRCLLGKLPPPCLQWGACVSLAAAASFSYVSSLPPYFFSPLPLPACSLPSLRHSACLPPLPATFLLFLLASSLPGAPCSHWHCFFLALPLPPTIFSSLFSCLSISTKASLSPLPLTLHPLSLLLSRHPPLLSACLPLSHLFSVSHMYISTSPHLLCACLHHLSFMEAEGRRGLIGFWTFGAWRQRRHDDACSALCCIAYAVCWQAAAFDDMATA